MIEKIKIDLPNFPDEVIRDWLAPYAERIGWLPEEKNWNGILFDRPLTFWQQIVWSKKKIDLNKVKYSVVSEKLFAEMKNAHLNKVENCYYRNVGSKDRYVKSLKYLMSTGKFPRPICLLKEEEFYSVVDGNHRMVAYLVY
jgi:hypothetical protein